MICHDVGCGNIRNKPKTNQIPANAKVNVRAQFLRVQIPRPTTRNRNAIARAEIPSVSLSLNVNLCTNVSLAAAATKRAPRFPSPRMANPARAYTAPRSQVWIAIAVTPMGRIYRSPLEG